MAETPSQNSHPFSQNPEINPEIEKQITRARTNIDFLKKIVLDHKALDLIMVGYIQESQEFKSLNFTVKQLQANITFSSTEKKEELNRLFRFYHTYFKVKIIQNPPKIVEFSLEKFGNGVYGDFEAMLNGYRLATMTALTIEDLLDYDPVDAAQGTHLSPISFFEWFIRSLVNSVFYCFFIDFILLMPRMKNLDYFADVRNQDEYNDKSGNICSSLFKSFDETSRPSMLQSASLNSERFTSSLKKNYKKFFSFCDLATKIGAFLEPLYQANHQFNGFFLDGFCGNYL